MPEFDIAVIGAGPAAIAALQSLSARQSLVVITGEVPAAIRPSLVHPKIRTVALSRRTTPELAEPFLVDDRTTLYASAAVGGLAKYWGQQFVRYAANDPWPRHIFGSYEAYIRSCQRVERAFCVRGGEEIGNLDAEPPYQLTIPRLLRSEAGDEQADLQALPKLFDQIVAHSGFAVIPRRVSHFTMVPGGCRVVLDNGDSVVARRIIIAAGVIGTARLISRSFQDVREACFFDHIPWMIYSIGLNFRIGSKELYQNDHFNAIVVSRLLNGKSEIHASIYNLRLAPLNLILASTINQVFSSLVELRAPVGSGLIQPIQVWTSQCFATINMTFGRHPTQSSQKKHDRSDDDLTRFKAALSRSGVRIIGQSSTKPGLGFHYHGLRFEIERGQSLDISSLLEQRTDGRIICVDASILDKIGCKPHTLTAMAAANAICERL